MTSLSLIMPAYNEGQHLHNNLVRVCETLQGFDLEIIVVDDGSTDNTFGEGERAAKRGLPIRVIRHTQNKGKGAALFRGFAETRKDLVAFLDSDLEITPENLVRLLKVMQNEKVELVIGTKAFERSQFPLARRIMSRTFRILVSLLFGLQVSDTQTGIKLFRREVLEKVIPRMSISRFAFDVELLVAASRFGYRIAECPVTAAYHRSGSFGRMTFMSMLHMFFDMLKIYYRASFWSWLQPGLMTRIWMITFAAGIFLFGVGVGKILTPVVLQPPLSQIFYFIALQFLPTTLRDWILLIGGALMVVTSLWQLNKSILAAFARRDRDGLAGILHQ